MRRRRATLPDSVYAFPTKRKEPLFDGRHVRNAVARFDQVIGKPDADRALAFANIEKAAKFMTSIFRRRRRTISAFIRNAHRSGRPPGGPLRPGARAASCKSAPLCCTRGERERERETSLQRSGGN